MSKAGMQKQLNQIVKYYAKKQTALRGKRHVKRCSVSLIIKEMQIRAK